jgi:hypothetical protein
MTRVLSHIRAGMLVACAALIAAGCAKEDIPSTPSPPFLFTSMIIGKTTTPAPGTALHVGQTVTVQFEVDYTLAPADDATRPKLGLLAGVLSRNAANADTVLVGASATPPVLPASSGAIPQSVTFKVPAGSKQIFVIAFIDTLPSVSAALLVDSQAWPVQ